MSIIQGNAHTSAGGGGYQIERSLRFNSADSAYLNRTPASTGSQTAWTWSAWVKRSTISTSRENVYAINNSNRISFSNDDSSQNLVFEVYNGSGADYFMQTSAVYRDPSAWYHIVAVWDSNNGTAADRQRLYVNGVRITAFSATGNTVPSGATSNNWNTTSANNIGRSPVTANHFSGYLTELYFIDGQALTPSSFGETDSSTGVWKPKAYSGTYGTNGFYLKFADNSNTTAATLGKDSSGNGNNWTPNNFSVTAGAGNDSLVDSPTSYGTDTGVGGSVRGNYATFNALQGTSTLSNGNLQIVGPIGDALRASTLGLTSGKWYAEITIASALSASASMGIAIYNQAALPTVNGTASRGYFYNGQKYSNGTLANYGTSFTNGDVIGIAIDLDNAKLWFSKNGTWQASGDPVAGTNAAYTDLGTTSTWFITVQTGGATGGATCHANFGQRAFSYTAPSGFKALCTQNLPTPTIGATSTTQANDYFDVKTWSGNSSTQSIALEFAPGLIWNKSRSGAAGHAWWDVLRGTGAQISSSETNAESTGYNAITSFSNNAISLGADNTGTSNGRTNETGRTYVGWVWNAGGSNATNTSGSITSTVRANTTSGFSIVTYTGNGATGGTVGHGLGVKPGFIIVKKRSATGGWVCWHQSLTGGSEQDRYIYLDLTSGSGVTTNYWGSGITSSTFGVWTTGGDNNTSGATIVAYCFAPVAGYSAFGSYTGNGSADGPFVFTNHRPAFLLVKRTDTTSNWTILDFQREGYNIDNDPLYPNLSDAEGTADLADILSNGFKLRSTDASVNASGGTYIYMSLASNPFKYSLAR